MIGLYANCYRQTELRWVTFWAVLSVIACIVTTFLSRCFLLFVPCLLALIFDRLCVSRVKLNSSSRIESRYSKWNQNLEPKSTHTQSLFLSFWQQSSVNVSPTMEWEVHWVRLISVSPSEFQQSWHFLSTKLSAGQKQTHLFSSMGSQSLHTFLLYLVPFLQIPL